MQVYDLARAWDRFRAGQERDFLEEEDGVWTYRRRIDAPVQLAWEALTAPEFKVRWMDGVGAIRMENPEGRLGPGSVYHCAHELAEFVYRITDWQPFDYFSTRIKDPAREGVELPETYQLTPVRAEPICAIPWAGPMTARATGPRPLSRMLPGSWRSSGPRPLTRWTRNWRRRTETRLAFLAE